MKTRSLTAVDLFAGCGGLSCGAVAAGFEILAGVDVEPKYMASFTHNFGAKKSISADLHSLAPDEFAQRLALKPGDLDLLMGGPPCQGFSKNVPRSRRFMEDPRNSLVRRFLEYCEYLRPRAVLMENVAEMRNGFDQAYSEEVSDRLHAAGYSVAHAVLNAAEYGVPQRRRRAFFLAIRDATAVRVPNPTHAPESDEGALFALPSFVSVWDAIGDLPSVEHGEGSDPCEYATAPLHEYQAWARASMNGRVRNHVARRLAPTQFSRLASLEPGQGARDLPPELQTRGGYSGAYGRLTEDMIAPTITRWVFHPGSGRWGHPRDIRTLTIREIARIQGFPDSFEFTGSFNDQAGQLGNAVPPLLAQRVIDHLKTLMAA